MSQYHKSWARYSIITLFQIHWQSITHFHSPPNYEDWFDNKSHLFTEFCLEISWSFFIINSNRTPSLFHGSLPIGEIIFYSGWFHKRHAVVPSFHTWLCYKEASWKISWRRTQRANGQYGQVHRVCVNIVVQTVCVVLFLFNWKIKNERKICSHWLKFRR